MNEWLKISFLVCVFGVLKEFRPSEPFIYEFMIGPWNNLTEVQINQEVFPVNVFSNLSLLVIVFLVTDLCRYKPLIVLIGLCGTAIWGMLSWTSGLLEFQILEAIYGLYLSLDVAYYTYIYAKVSRNHYQQVTGHARAAYLAGRCLSAALGQILLSFKQLDRHQLNYISFTAQMLATLWAFTLPSADKSIYFNQDNITTIDTNHKRQNKFKSAFRLLWKHFVDSYSKLHVIKWSLWWSMATCISLQIQNYMQPLFSVIRHEDESDYNGVIEALSMLLGSFSALLAGNIRANWELKRELLLTLCSTVIGAVLLLTAQTEQILVSYACYLVFIMLYQFMVTIASSEVAKYIVEDTYGLVFGLNTFVSLVLQTILTVIVVNGDVGLGLSPRNQFFVYGGYFFVIAVIYFVIGVFNWHRNKQREM